MHKIVLRALSTVTLELTTPQYRHDNHYSIFNMKKEIIEVKSLRSQIQDSNFNDMVPESILLYYFHLVCGKSS